MRNKLCGWAAAVLLVFGAAAAEEAAPVTLTLADAVGRALEVDEGYRSAQEDVASAEAGVKVARAAFLPPVSLSADASKLVGLRTTQIPANIFGPGMPPEPIEFSLAPDKNITLGATLTQPLYQGGRDYTGYHMAKVSRNLSGEKLRQSRTDVIYNVVRAYYGAVLADEAVRVADASVAVAMSHVQATEDRYDAGLVSEYDVLRARVQLSNLETAQREASDRRLLANRYLLNLLTLPSDTSLALTDRLSFNLETFNEEESVATAAAKRTELVQLDMGRELADFGVKQARSGDNPVVMFVAAYQYYAQDFTADFSRTWKNQGTLALSVSWPIFDWFATRNKVRQSRVEVYKVERTQELVKKGVELEVRTAYDVFMTAEKTVRSQQDNVELAQRGLDIAQARYEAGLMSNLEVLDAQSALTQAELGYYRALHDYDLAKFALRRARGDLDAYAFN